MPITMCVSRTALAKLQCLIEANPSVDWRTIALGDAAPDAMDLRGLDPEAMTPLLKAYQRLVRVLPPSEERRALPLLESGLHSAVQIAEFPRDEFARCWAALFPGEDELGIAVHRAALSRRGDLLLHHVNKVQRNEPHYRAARFK